MKRMLPMKENVTRTQDMNFWVRAVIYAVLITIGVLVPRATVYGGLSPFGVSLVACVDGTLAFPVAVSTIVGYMIAPQVVMPLRYVAAILSALGFCWAFGVTKKVTAHPLYAPITAFFATLVTGLALNGMNGFQWSVMISELCESVLAGGFAYFFKQMLTAFQNASGPRSLNMQQQAALVVTAAVLLMSLGDLTFGEVSVGRILTMTVILLASKAGGQYGGTLVGVVLGAATALCMPEHAPMASSYAFGGLLTGLFSRFGRMLAAMVFVLSHVLISFSFGESDTVITALYEVLAGAALFLVLPLSVERGVNALFCRAQTIPAMEGLRRSVDMRLVYASDTLGDIAKTVDTVSEKLSTMNAPRLREVYTAVCEDLCAGCFRRTQCWKAEFSDTMAVFKDMGQTLRSNGIVRREDLCERFVKQCHHTDEVLSRMNNGYGHFLIKEHAYHRLGDIRSIVTDQFEGMSSLLEELAEDFKGVERVDPQTAVRVEEVCERYKMPIVQTVCILGRRDRLVVELLVEGEQSADENSRWFREMCVACGCDLAPPSVMHSGQLTKIRLTEKPKFTVRFASAQLNCQTEKLCGDAFEEFYDYDGRYCVVLSDGMGTGGRAAVDGAMTAALAGRMLQAGFRFESVLRMINSALILKSEDESLSTLDAIQIDLFTGTVRGLKAGAAPSFLCHRGRVTKVLSDSLPIGILRDVDAQPYDEHLESGDYWIMVSDGVADGDTEWLEEAIAKLVKRNVGEQAMASELVFYARERQSGEHGDDTTALVLRIA
ncbi:MAG: SpoIIE family protein phosphatase [Clostridia bacterium]|nr:SpoIIE family protein phosphatase [Clostridia bacterium]